ncbi:MAG: DNA cytosine methyltransferase [Ureaplasma sp.]|nr:DNA cytosine methyltransferase [Ureaplasma sp.]
MSPKYTYISLFSCGGIGCFGFKKQGFECLATAELLKKRLNIQEYNNKCKYKSGYINGDLSLPETKETIYNEIKKWDVNDVSLIVATPPCQGMSNANSKKNENDIFRNSLIIDAIQIIKKVLPRYIVFENVPSFLKTVCNYNGSLSKIRDVIESELESIYNIEYKIVNFANYGVPSSRNRTLVIGVRKDVDISPLLLFPDIVKRKKTLKDTIFNLKRLKNMGEIDVDDIYHFYRSFDKRMLPWIENLKEGESAFDNIEPHRIPHRILNNQVVFNKNKMGGKYKRQIWDGVSSCIHTRNDQLASQNTIHPTDNRVFSIRELMILMSIPKEFKWTNDNYEYLNSLSLHDKRKFLKSNENNIRQMIGEAVPTLVFEMIAKKIKKYENE